MSEQIERELYSILEDVKAQLSDDDYTYIQELIQHREWGVGFEHMCTQLYEYGAIINETVFKKITYSGNNMGLPEDKWSMLVECPRQEVSVKVS